MRYDGDDRVQISSLIFSSPISRTPEHPEAPENRTRTSPPGSTARFRRAAACAVSDVDARVSGLPWPQATSGKDARPSTLGPQGIVTLTAWKHPGERESTSRSLGVKEGVWNCRYQTRHGPVASDNTAATFRSHQVRNLMAHNPWNLAGISRAKYPGVGLRSRNTTSLLHRQTS